MARKSIEWINKVYDKILSLGVSKVVCNKRLVAFKYPNEKNDGENDWINKWRCLGKPNTQWYRLYSHFIGNNIDIVPDDIMSNIIEPILNPVRYRSLYEDKNLLDNYFMIRFKEKKITPPTLLRSINRGLYSGEFDFISAATGDMIIKGCHAQRLISKASIDENSARGIYFWEKVGDSYQLIDGKEILSISSLNLLYPHGNYILQEVAEQSEFMNYLCSTSVNTLRVHMYRSVKDEKPHLVNAVVRIGKEGSLVDNAHAGGSWCGIHKDSGELQDFVIDQHAEKRNVFNGIDFSKERLCIPNWAQVEKFCEDVMLCLPHMRNLALDVMITKEGNPMIIEYNTDKFATFFYQLTTSAVFAEFTDEVIEYCKNNKDKASRVFVTF